MDLKPRILAFAGSARRDSRNRKLLVEAVAAARQAGAEVDPAGRLVHSLRVAAAA